MIESCQWDMCVCVGGGGGGGSTLVGIVLLHTLTHTSEVKVAEVVVPDWVALSVLTKATTRKELLNDLSRIE